MSIQKTLAIAFVVTLLSTTSLVAAEGQNEPRQIETVSGGIGDTDLVKIAAMQTNYSLKLIFADTAGAYLADIGVQILDRKGNTLVNTTSSGPILLVNISPGTYTLSSTINGTSKTQRIVVQHNHLATYYIHLPSIES